MDAAIRVGIPRTGVDWCEFNHGIPHLTGLQSTGLTKYIGDQLGDDGYGRLHFDYDPHKGRLSVTVKPSEPLNDDLAMRVKRLITEYVDEHF